MMTDKKPILRVTNITKSFGDITILKSVSIELAKGDIKILIGPSGGGKSTLLQCINCLVLPDSGEIELDNKRIHFTRKQDIYRLRQQVGMIFQDFNLFDHLTALDNITVALRKVKKMSKKEAEKRARLELKQVGLDDKEDLYPAQLSGGQKQRVAIARALAMDPKILLLDEPTSALDPTLIGEVISVIKELAIKGMTMIMATHQISLIHNLADEILFMEDGRIVEQGPPGALLAAGNTSKSQGFCDLLDKLSEVEE
ncbi:amino acid ABC transporter ATP-binding protein [Desulforhopalus vacuolatus]|uniref:amino acid ABC transporter ATP-binding protein n=1 Tax=Desulforhopalus vacuolatus TaxID=40414 RepID=UPI00196664B5|nr:amino acid ABC transporter ATP-binding protein [Desulforhopalus vacuolatus]MBM9518749.1 amino acid ABC transporter ATP-binding protein [Desulforhopalus vacuolatus]